jgi:hypothetical protein
MAVVNPVTGNEASGGLYFQGYAYLQTLTVDAPMNAPATVAGTFEGDGQWEYGTTT